MNREPAVLIGAFTAFTTGVIGLLVAFGVDVSQETQEKVITGAVSIIGAIFVIVPFIRQTVYSPASAEKIDAGAQPRAADAALPR